MKNLRILLTGGSGMVGRNFLEHLGVRQFQVLAPTRSELDLLDFSSVRSYLRHYRPDLVIHAAGKVGGIQANLNEPVAFLLENLDMGRNIVWASKQEKIQRLLNIGSSCMYPRDCLSPLTEEMILQGSFESSNEGYAIAKVVIARLADFIRRENAAFRYKTVIPCNLYGRFDKFDPQKSHLIPAIIHKVSEAIESGDELVEIWGNGTARREFMYAGDFADFLVTAATRFDELPNVMNVGVGSDKTINEYYSEVASVLGFNGAFRHDHLKPVGMDRKLLSIEKQIKWGWKTIYSLSEGIEKTYRYYTEEYQK